MLMLALVCALFSACAIEASLPTESAAPTPAQKPEAAPTPAPTPEPDADALCTMCRDGFFAAFAPDYSGHDYTSLGMLDMLGLIEKQPLYAELAADTHTLAQMCAQTAAHDVKAMSSLIDRTSVTVTGKLDWRLIAAACTMLDEPDKAIAAHTDVSVTIEGKTLNVCVSLPDFDALFAPLASDVHYGAMSLYCYLNTTYDNNAQILDNDGSYELSDEYIATIIDPLPKRHIKDGWYGDRSKSTRRHMGTDIRAREWQDIPSCTAGEIVRILPHGAAYHLPQRRRPRGAGPAYRPRWQHRKQRRAAPAPFHNRAGVRLYQSLPRARPRALRQIGKGVQNPFQIPIKNV